jgi:hypothetical protein
MGMSNEVWNHEDVVKLINGVLEARMDTYYNPNGRDATTCPFCLEEIQEGWASAVEIDHAPDCVYLIAKDMSTNL